MGPVPGMDSALAAVGDGGGDIAECQRSVSWIRRCEAGDCNQDRTTKNETDFVNDFFHDFLLSCDLLIIVAFLFSSCSVPSGPSCLSLEQRPCRGFGNFERSGDLDSRGLVFKGILRCRFRGETARAEVGYRIWSKPGWR